MADPDTDMVISVTQPSSKSLSGGDDDYPVQIGFRVLVVPESPAIQSTLIATLMPRHRINPPGLSSITLKKQMMEYSGSALVMAHVRCTGQRQVSIDLKA